MFLLFYARRFSGNASSNLKGSDRMRRFTAFLAALLLLFGAARAETVSFGGVSFDRNAETIDLGDQVVGNWADFSAFLKKFPNLKQVNMFATTVDAARVEKLEKAFPGIEFGWTLKMMYYHIIRSDAEAYSTLHGFHPKHRSSEFVLLKYCTKLKALDLGHNNLTDISFLRSMPHLRVLILGDNNHLKNIETVGELKELEYLELFSCGITDISPLTKLTNLMDLNLANNAVKDWRPLKEMKWLKRLWISGMCRGKMKKYELSAEERQELEEALPDTRIEYLGQPTDNGWREDPATGLKDPHYEVIFRMFNTGTVYIPFEDSKDALPEDSDVVIAEDIEADELPDGSHE